MTGFRLFEAHGVEIEYAVVDRETMAVRPIADAVLQHDGATVNELEDGAITWSNELARHVIELKTSAPAPSLDPLSSEMRRSVDLLLERLAPLGATLLPGGAHPFMDPHVEFSRWVDDDAEIYEAFDRVFDCRGHGWANLQSVHLNLPFQGDDEFGRLHAAIRLVLPILPAMSATTPILDGRRAPNLNQRLAVYRTNAIRIPRVTGAVIPEPVFDEAGYRREILEPLYRDIAPYDPDGVLQHEWLNARGAIARFERDTIEIRVMDCQEHPAVDIALCAGVTAVVRHLVEEHWSSYQAQKAQPVEPLAALFDRTVAEAESVLVDDRAYLASLGWPNGPVRAQKLWAHLLERAGVLGGAFGPPLQTILEQGSLASRIVRAVPDEEPPRGELVELCRRLSTCLVEGRMFQP